MATMPIYVKPPKSLLLQNQESFEAESWYIASGMQSTEFVQMIITRLTFLRHSQNCVLIVATFEECCMASADMQ